MATPYMCNEGMVFKEDIFDIDAKAVGTLREKTGARLMDCKEALQEAKAEMQTKRDEENRPATQEEIADMRAQLAQVANDPNLTLVTENLFYFPVPIDESTLFQMAVSKLKAKNLATGAARRKVGTEGRIAILEANGMVVGVGLSCETDFVAKNSEFIDALDFVTAKIAKIATPAPLDSSDDVRTALIVTQSDEEEITRRLVELSGKLGESISISHRTAVYGSTFPGAATGYYLHHDYKQAAVVALEGGDSALAKQVAMHCVFAKPKYEKRDGVPKEIVTAELALITKRLSEDPKNASKPKEILEKIADGQLKKFYSTCVLPDQPFFKDNAVTVGQLLAKANVKNVTFDLLEIGG